MAEAFCNTIADNIVSWSAGTLAFTPAKYGNPTKDIVRVMKEKDIDVSQAKVKTVTGDMVYNSENIIVLCKKDECPAFVQSSHNVVYWENIEDPYSKNMEDVRKIRDQIEQKVKELLK